MKTFRSFVAMLVVFGATLISSPASASLIGDTISASGNSVVPPAATIGSGTEFSGVWKYINFDFDADTLTVSSINYLSSWSGFGSYTFSGFDETINAVSLASNAGFAAYTGFITNFSFTADSITFDFNAGGVSNPIQGAVAVFNITSAAEVPEPSMLALLGLALAGLIVARRRKMV